MTTLRKCGLCGVPGHTRRRCTMEEGIPVGCSHPDGFTWADDGNGRSGSFCGVCGAPDTAAEKLERHQAVMKTARDQAPEVVFEDPTPRSGTCGPVYASFTSECTECDGAIFEGELIFPDGEGGWACDDCHNHRPEPVAAPTPAPTPEVVFEDPTPATEKREYTNNRGYLAKDPRTGEFRRYKNGNVQPFTRVSTFVKAGSDRTALTAWSMRNTLLGMAHSPDLVAEVLRLHPHPEGPLPEDKDTKQALDQIVERVGKRVGSKRAADRGTAIHNSIEMVAKGRATLEEIPTDHVPWVTAFLDALMAKGLEVVPDMVERTVFIPQFGGVMGRFDLTVRHVASGAMLLSDVKTGRVDYAWEEIETQLALYVAGYTQHGTYEWAPVGHEEDDRWLPPVHALDVDHGIVFHLPVKEGSPRCDVLDVDLRRGWRRAEFCAAVRENNREKPKPAEWEPPGPLDECQLPECTPPQEPEDREWEAEFGRARDRLHLAGLYESAYAVFGGQDEERLRGLIAIGTARLESLANASA